MLHLENYPIPAQDRARHWCLPHCPGQEEFVNYSCGAGENCILLAPLAKVCFVYFRFTFENVGKFHGLASMLVLENMLSHARTMFYWVLNEVLSNIQVFKGK